MSQPIYEEPDEALQATDEFYWNQEGFQYPEEKVTSWIRKYVSLPRTGRVLDLCCGDGIWSKGIANVNPDLELFGVDLSQGGIEKARGLLQADERHFVVGDAEAALPFDDDFFTFIFARGPGLFNQHSMDRPATIAVLEAWHRKLTARGRFFSTFGSNPRLLGTYTPMDKVKLPFNRCPRKTPAVDFRGGKYHHTIQSFLTPFWKASGVEIVQYSFQRNRHLLVTRWLDPKREASTKSARSQQK